jgi:hypothetical protein
MPNQPARVSTVPTGGGEQRRRAQSGAEHGERLAQRDTEFESLCSLRIQGHLKAGRRERGGSEQDAWGRGKVEVSDARRVRSRVGSKKAVSAPVRRPHPSPLTHRAHPRVPTFVWIMFTTFDNDDFHVTRQHHYRQPRRLCASQSTYVRSTKPEHLGEDVPPTRGFHFLGPRAERALRRLGSGCDISPTVTVRQEVFLTTLWLASSGSFISLDRDKDTQNSDEFVSICTYKRLTYSLDQMAYCNTPFLSVYPAFVLGCFTA